MSNKNHQRVYLRPPSYDDTITVGGVIAALWTLAVLATPVILLIISLIDYIRS